MLDMIQQMASDRLWIYTALGGSVLGAIFVAWIGKTRLGLWAYSKTDNALDYMVYRWGLTWLEVPEDAWRKKYPRITKKIDEIEARLDAVEPKKLGGKTPKTTAP